MGGAAVRPKSYAAGQLVTGLGIYKGFTLRETGGTNPAVIQIYDNTAGSGLLLDTIQLPAGTDDRGDFNNGVWFTNGIFIVLTGTGVVEGSIFLG